MNIFGKHKEERKIKAEIKKRIRAENERYRVLGGPSYPRSIEKYLAKVFRAQIEAETATKMVDVENTNAASEALVNVIIKERDDQIKTTSALAVFTKYLNGRTSALTFVRPLSENRFLTDEKAWERFTALVPERCMPEQLDRSLVKQLISYYENDEDKIEDLAFRFLNGIGRL